MHANNKTMIKKTAYKVAGLLIFTLQRAVFFTRHAVTLLMAHAKTIILQSFCSQ